jgi:hypothetical protein
MQFELSQDGFFLKGPVCLSQSYILKSVYTQQDI